MVECFLAPSFTYKVVLWTVAKKIKVATLANKIYCLAGNFVLGNFKTMVTSFLERAFLATPALNAIVKSSLALYMNIINQFPNNTVRGLILNSRASLGGGAQSSLAADLVDKLALQPEIINVPTRSVLNI